MKKKFDGFSKALGILDKFGQEERLKILELLSKIDPKITEKLKEEIVTLEDLIFLNKEMLSKFLRKIELSDLGLCLRVSSSDLADFIISNVSERNQEEINHSFKGPPKPLDLVLESYGKVLLVFKEMLEKGEIYINKDPLV
jgi:flagellar motor switch protein FliG